MHIAQAVYHHSALFRRLRAVLADIKKSKIEPEMLELAQHNQGG